jgi:ATP phosphoribosyltransferase regulatory subunit
LRALPEALVPRRVLLPLGTDCTRANALRTAGWVTVAALTPVGDWWAEAHRLGCSHVLEGENPVAVG